MVIAPDIEAQILRYHHAEKWTVGTIARQLHVHHSTVRRVLAQAGLPRIGPPPRPSPIDAYLPFIRQTLETFPTLTASRLYAMACERGYRGSPDHFRHLIACHRPRPKAEAYLRLRSPSWRTGAGGLGPLRPPPDRPRPAAVDGVRDGAELLAPDLPALLPRRPHGELPAGHVGAFAAWRGVPRVVLYDNLKSAVLERHGAAIRFHPTLLGFAGTLSLRPAPRRGRPRQREGVCFILHLIRIVAYQLGRDGPRLAGRGAPSRRFVQRGLPIGHASRRGRIS